MLMKPRNYENDILHKQNEKAINIFRCVFIQWVFELCDRPQVMNLSLYDKNNAGFLFLKKQNALNIGVFVSKYLLLYDGNDRDVQ